ncbi:MAG: hypothetical protein ACK4L7_01925, partial [Flavobacteriales bacterium]
AFASWRSSRCSALRSARASAARCSFAWGIRMPRPCRRIRGASRRASREPRFSSCPIRRIPSTAWIWTRSFRAFARSGDRRRHEPAQAHFRQPITTR